MAKRTPTRAAPAESEADENGPGAREEAAIDLVRQAVDDSGLGTDWKFIVTRLAGPQKTDGGKYENHLFKREIDELPQLNVFLATEYGDGIYRVRVWRDRSIFKQWDIVIELSPTERAAYREKVRMLSAGPVPPAAAPAAGGDAGIAALLAQQTELMRQLIERTNTPPVNPIDSFGAVAAAFKSFQELQPKPEVTTGVDMFTKGMELAKEIMADRDAPASRTGVLDLIRDAINNPNIGEAVGAFVQNIRPVQQQPQQQQRRPQQQQPQRTPIAPAAPRPATLDPQGQAEVADVAPAHPNDAMVLQAIDYLCTQARAGVQPQLFSDQALEMMPNGLLMELERAEDMLAFLVDRFPQIEAHRPWFEALLGDMFPPEEGELDAAPAAEHAEPAAVAP